MHFARLLLNSRAFDVMFCIIASICKYERKEIFNLCIYFEIDSSVNRSMKEIKGLDERLASLQQRLIVAKQFVQDQADMAQVTKLSVFLFLFILYFVFYYCRSALPFII